jgi:hypothetical protein
MTSFHECLEYALNSLTQNKVICEEIHNTMFHGGVSYGETRKWSFPVERINGKFSDAYVHLTISRDEYGRYDTTCYCL